MVKFGKKLLQSQYSPWENYYIDYKRLKKILHKKGLGLNRQLEQQQTQEQQDHLLDHGNLSSLNNQDDDATAKSVAMSITEPVNETNNQDANIIFREALDRQIENTVLFLLQQQGTISSQLSQFYLQKEQLLYDHNYHDSMQDNNVQSTLDLIHKYTNLGEEILHLIHFVELNGTALRKILKKHDKIYDMDKISHLYLSRSVIVDINIGMFMMDRNHEHNDRTLHGDGSRKGLYYDSHLNQLYHYGGISALVTSLKMALYELRNHHNYLMFQQEQNQQQERQRSESLPINDRNINLEYDYDNRNSWINWSPIDSYHKLQSRTSTLTTATGNTNTASPQVAADYTMIPQQRQEEPILIRIDNARRRLNQSKEYVDVLASQLMMLDDTDSNEDDSSQTYLQGQDEIIKTKGQGISRWLNLISTFLYMTNYYIVAPTCGVYAEQLGSSSAMGGIIIGMTPLAALTASILYAWWSNHSYKSALLFASFCCLLGDLMYALALHYHSLSMVIVGRYLNGFGSARAINRRYIADTFSRRERTAASAAFVTAGALGMAFGPAIAAILGQLSYSGDVWNVHTSPGWIMFLMWSIYFMCTMLYFKDPKQNKSMSKKRKVLSSSSHATDSMITNSEKSPLLPVNGIYDEKQVDAEKKTGQKLPSLWKNTPVISTLWNYFVLKLVLECLLSSSSVLTSFYFDWNLTKSGFLLAVLGLLMFPANLLVAQMSHRYEEREMIRTTLTLMSLGIGGVLCYGNEDYTVFQYVCFAICIFLGTNALEGPNMSLLSKSVPTAWAKGTFNSGFLATEAGTLGRVAGDVLVSLVSFMSNTELLLNGIFIPNLLLVIFTLTLTHVFYSSLEPKDDDDDDDETDEDSTSAIK